MAPLTLKYGRQAFECDLPQAQVLQAGELPVITDPAGAVRKALVEPIGSPRLEAVVKPGERVVIVTSDITRYSGSEVYLPILVEELNRIGVADGDISILIGLGIHRKQTAEEHRKILGELYGRIAVHDHECDDPTALAELGTTDSGIPVQVNRRVVDADRVIVTGTIGFHYFAGFGGGRKGLVPGIAGRETCMASHFAVFNPPEVGGKHPNAVTGVLDGNPVHRNLLQAARLVQPDFLLNTVLSPRKEFLGVFCGDMEQAHLAGCAMVRDLFQIRLESPADLAVVSCGGDPKDINFIQSQKALDYGCRAIHEGGTIILLAACPDGFGYPTFFDWFRYQQGRAKGGARSVPDGDRHRRTGRDRIRRAAGRALPALRPARVHLQPRLADGRPDVLGQPLRPAYRRPQPDRGPVLRPPYAPHDHRGRSRFLSQGRRPGAAFPRKPGIRTPEFP